MAMTLITTNTSSNAANSSFTSSIDSTYKLYIFKYYDVNPVTDGADFTFQVNAAGASGFNEAMTTSIFYSYHNESGSDSDLIYQEEHDQVNDAEAYQRLADSCGNGADESSAGTLWLFNPSNTTYVKHFYATGNVYFASDYSINNYVAGYVNITGAVDEVDFKMSIGNMDSIIKMYGVG